MIRRVFKLLPVYYTVILYNYLLHAILLRDVPPDLTGIYWWRYILLINTTVPTNSSFWFNLSATWTVPVFMLFYLMVPLFKRIIKNYYYALAMTVILFFISYNMVVITEWCKPVTYLWYFAVGIVVWFAINENKKDLSIVLFASGCLVLYIFRGYDITYSYIFVFVILIISTMELKLYNNKLKFIINRLDKLSYSIYLVHFNVIELIRNINLSKGIFNNVEMVLLILLLTFLISYFIMVCIERNGLKLGRSIALEWQNRKDRRGI